MRTYLRTDLAWAAGFFDGEGSLSIYYQPRIKCFGTDVQITQVEKEPLEKLTSMFGGYMHLRMRNDSKNARDCWLWRLRGRESTSFVKLIYPYLKLKKKQADVFLQMRESIESHHSCRRRPIPTNVFADRMQLVRFISYLNKRGKA